MFGACHVQDHVVVHFGTYPFRYQSDLNITFGPPPDQLWYIFGSLRYQKLLTFGNNDRHVCRRPQLGKISVIPCQTVSLF